MHEFEDLSDALFGCPLSRVAIFDTETTGFSDGDEILEIAVVDGYGETLLSSYVRPQHHTKWPGAAEVNHITFADVGDAPTIEELAPSLAETLGSAGLVSGYNVSYDLSMLRRVGVLSSWPRNTFDVMKEFARVHGKPSRKWGSKRWVRLSECAATYGYTFHPHDAEDDARATAFCFRHLLADGSYLRIAAQERSGRLQMALGQRKAAVEAAASLLEKQGPGTYAAELCWIEGACAGKQNLACCVDGVPVGLVPAASFWKVRTFFGEEEAEDGMLSCQVRLGEAQGRPHAQLVLMDEEEWLDELVRLARIAHSS